MQLDPAKLYRLGVFSLIRLQMLISGQILWTNRKEAGGRYCDAGCISNHKQNEHSNEAQSVSVEQRLRTRRLRSRLFSSKELMS